MATDLAKQLEKLRQADHAGIVLPKNTKASFLFDGRQAAELDLQTIHSLGLNGLAELRKLNERFAPFEKTLFGTTAKSVDRELQTKEANEKLDHVLDQFLRLLSPFFLLPAAHKSLEYLIRRYKIHEYNVDSIFACILPFHETNFFVRMVMLMKLDRTRWHFLSGVRKSQAALKRSTLVEQAQLDYGLLDFVCQLAKLAVANKQSSKTLLSFYGVFVVEVIAAAKRVSDDLISRILPYILEGLKNAHHNIDYQAASIMIVTQIACATTLTPDLLHSLLEAVVQHVDVVSVQETLLCVSLLFQTQELSTFPFTAFKFFIRIPDIVGHLSQIAEQGYNLTPLFKPFVSMLVANVTSYEKNISLLTRVIAELPISTSIVQSAVADIFKLYFSIFETDQSKEQVARHETIYRTILSSIEKKFPREVGQAMEDAFVQAKKKDRRAKKQEDAQQHNFTQLLFDFVSRSFTGSRQQPLPGSHTSLFLSLQHPESHVRITALNQLKQMQVTSENESFIAGALLDRLEDEDVEVVRQVLKFENLDDLIAPESLFDSLYKLIHRLQQKSNAEMTRTNTSVMRVALKVLVSVAQKSDQLLERSVPILLDTILISPMTRKLNRSAISYARNVSHPLFNGLNKLLQKKAKTVKAAEGDPIQTVIDLLDSSFNAELIQLVAHNIAADVDTLLPLVVKVIGDNVGQTILLHALPQAFQQLSNRISSSSFLAHLYNVFCLVRTQWDQAESTQQLTNEFKSLSLSSAAATENGVASVETDLSAHGKILKLATLTDEIVKLLSNFEKSDNQDSCALLSDVFVFLLSRPSFMDHSLQIANILRNNKFIRSPMRFLSSYWMADPKEYPEMVQVRSLHLAQSFFLSSLVVDGNNKTNTNNTNNNNNNLSISVDGQCLIPSLLVALRNSNQSVRHAALIFLQSLRDLRNNDRSSSQGVIRYEIPGLYTTGTTGKKEKTVAGLSAEESKQLLVLLTRSREELLIDEHFLIQLLGQVGKVDSTVSDGADGKAKKTKRSAGADNNTANGVQSGLVRFIVPHILSMPSLYAKMALLSSLNQVESVDLLSALLPMVSELLSDPLLQGGETLVAYQITENVLARLSRHNLIEQPFDFFKPLLVAVGSNVSFRDKKTNQLMSTQKTALACFNSTIYQSLTTEQAQELFSTLVELLLQKDVTVAAELHNVLRALPLSAEIWVHELNQILNQLKPSTVANGTTTMESRKKQKLSSSNEDGDLNRQSNQWTLRATLLLEVLQYKIDFVGNSALIAPLFELLRTLLSFNSYQQQQQQQGQAEDKEDVAVEFLKQLTLSALTTLTSTYDLTALDSSVNQQETDSSSAAAAKRKTPKKKAATDSNTSSSAIFDLDLVVTCATATDNPQTRSASLLLLAAMSRIFPARVLESVIPVFALSSSSSSSSSSASALSIEDNFSFHMLQKTVEIIVPPLVEHGLGLKPLLKVFADNILSIPVYRRAKLFTSLIQILGPGHCLDTFIFLVMNRCADKALFDNPTESTELQLQAESLYNSFMSLSHSLAASFAPKDQIHAMLKLAQHVICLPTLKATDSQQHTDGTDDRSKTVKKTPKKSDALNQSDSMNHVDVFDRKHQARNTQLSTELQLADYFDVAEYNTKHIRRLKLLLVQFISTHLVDKSFLNRLALLSEAEESLLHEEYKLLFETVLLSVRYFSELQGGVLGTMQKQKVRGVGAIARVIRTIERSLDEILNRLKDLLSVASFVQIVSELMRHKDMQIRRKALNLITDRIEKDPLRKEAKHADIYVSLVSDVTKFLPKSATDIIENDRLVIVQTAFIALDTLTRHFASSYTQQFVDSIPTVVNALQSSSIALKIGAAMCLASMVSHIGPNVLTYLPQFFPRLIAVLKDTIAYTVSTGSNGLVENDTDAMDVDNKNNSNKLEEDDASSSNTLLQQSVLTALEVVVSKLAKFISPYVTDLLSILVEPMLIDSPSNHKTETTIRFASVMDILSAMAKSIAARVLLPAIFASYDVSAKLGSVALNRLFHVTGELCAAMDNDSVASHYLKLYKFFLVAFDYRRQHKTSHTVAAVESSVIQSFLRMVMRLQESQMKPLFLKTLEWSNVPQSALTTSSSSSELSAPSLERQLFFFQLVDGMSDMLKTIFVPYFAYFLDTCISFLQQAHNRLAVTAEVDDDEEEDDEEEEEEDSDSDSDGEPKKMKSKKQKKGKTVLSSSISKKRKRTASASASASVDPTSSIEWALARSVLSSLHKCFLYDSDGFMDQEKFEKLVTPLVNTLDFIGLGSSYKRLSEELMVPCLSQLAVAAASDTMWKPLNYQVLMKTRSDHSQVRFAALRIVQEMLTRVGEPLLMFLPETLPFIAELMEDDDVQVEKLCQTVIKQIEELSGESIQEHLK